MKILMRYKNDFLMFGLGLLMMLAISAGTSMAATYRVEVDCYHTSLASTDTGNRITVSFLDANRNVIRRVVKSGIRNCSQRDSVFAINTNAVVRYIEFSTNGNDAFFIDKWRLTRDNRQITVGDRQNGKGWCLSTDRRDSVGLYNRTMQKQHSIFRCRQFDTACNSGEYISSAD
jgi:hypothetical protein